MPQEEPYRVLIAVELGAEWPRWMSEQVAGRSRRVETQGESESPAAFCERVLTTAREGRRGGQLESAVVLCNERTDTLQQAARRELLLGLPRSLQGRNKKLTLATSTTATARLRAALETLVTPGDGPARAPIRIESGPVAPARRVA